jgi:hypothetical protein
MVFKLLLFQKVPIQLNLIIFLDNINKRVFRKMLKLRSVFFFGNRGLNFKKVWFLSGFRFLFFAQAPFDPSQEVKFFLLLGAVGFEVLRATVGPALSVLNRIDRRGS